MRTIGKRTKAGFSSIFVLALFLTAATLAGLLFYTKQSFPAITNTNKQSVPKVVEKKVSSSSAAPSIPSKPTIQKTLNNTPSQTDTQVPSNNTNLQSSQMSSGTISVDKTSINTTIDRTGIQNGDNAYGLGFTITSQGANGWSIKHNTPHDGYGFDLSSGGLSPGSSQTIRPFVNTTKPNGVYSGSITVQYSSNGTDYDGPTISYSLTLTGQGPAADQSGTLTVDKNSVSVTLSKANAQFGTVYGSGFTITSQGATGFSVHKNDSAVGQGFEGLSGGVFPGSSTTIKSFINTDKPDGSYTGSSTVYYTKNGTDYIAGPTVTYLITLTD